MSNNENESSLGNLLQAAGIYSVVWIDDLFSEGNYEQQIISIKSYISTLKELDISPKNEIFKNFDFTVPEGIYEERLNELLSSNNDKLVEIENSLKAQFKEIGEDINLPNVDLTIDQVTSLIDAIKNVSHYCYKEWEYVKNDVLNSSSDGTLFLVDREFKNEGMGEELGDQIIEDIIKNSSSSYCVMLTHKISIEDAETLRLQIANSDTNIIKLHQFSVMSKRDLGVEPENAEPYLASALQVLITHRNCYEIAERMSNVLNKTLEKALFDLINQSVYDLDQSIFQNSLKEGASELDVFRRIFYLRQRLATKTIIEQDAPTIKKIERIRSIRSLNLLKRPDSPIPEMNRKIIEWRRAEIINSESYVNNNNSPIASGDIFSKIGTQRKFILLSQPCDLVVRGDGKRNAQEGYFLEFKIRKEIDKLQNLSRYYIIENMEDDGSSWVFDFRTLSNVNLDVLDLVAFHQKGELSISTNQEESSFLLPGWRLRFEKIKRALPTDQRNKPAKLRFLSLNRGLGDREGRWKNNKWYFPYKRIGRLRSPYSDSILGSLAAFLTRTAFEHDFSRNL